MGVRRCLKVAKECGVDLAICSNKPQHLVNKMLNELSLAPFFKMVIGSSENFSKKSNPVMLEHIIMSLKYSAQQAILIGDTTVDQQLSVNAAVDFVFFSSGYDDGVNEDAAFWRFSNFDEMTEKSTLPMIFRLIFLFNFVQNYSLAEGESLW